MRFHEKLIFEQAAKPGLLLMGSYIISGVIFIICIVVIIFGLRILKETRKMDPNKMNSDTGENQEAPRKKS